MRRAVTVVRTLSWVQIWSHVSSSTKWAAAPGSLLCNRGIVPNLDGCVILTTEVRFISYKSIIGLQKPLYPGQGRPKYTPGTVGMRLFATPFYATMNTHIHSHLGAILNSQFKLSTSMFLGGGGGGGGGDQRIWKTSSGLMELWGSNTTQPHNLNIWAEVDKQGHMAQHCSVNVKYS